MTEHLHKDCRGEQRNEIYWCLDHDVEICCCGWEVGWHYNIHADLHDTKVRTSYGALLARLVNMNHKFSYLPRAELEEEKRNLIAEHYKL